jgi:hypothetical protein
MASTKRTDLFGRIADMSEEAIQRLSDAPGADRVMGALNTLKDRTDELQKRVRGLEDLEKRLTAVEAKVAKLTKSAKAPSTKSAGTKSSSTKSANETEAKT